MYSIRAFVISQKDMPELIKNEINTLKYNPQKFAIIDYDIIKNINLEN